ncbi:hypothetical protein F5Y18DRAFT_376580 [Xylariaceae sp. FL1019]|nr:hypothetical protein F5Y18DRAFT_376580 [Xylariaceae sp. FL1019]
MLGQHVLEKRIARALVGAIGALVLSLHGCGGRVLLDRVGLGVVRGSATHREDLAAQITAEIAAAHIGGGDVVRAADHLLGLMRGFLRGSSGMVCQEDCLSAAGR